MLKVMNFVQTVMYDKDIDYLAVAYSSENNKVIDVDSRIVRALPCLLPSLYNLDPTVDNECIIEEQGVSAYIRKDTFEVTFLAYDNSEDGLIVSNDWCEEDESITVTLTYDTFINVYNTVCVDSYARN